MKRENRQEKKKEQEVGITNPMIEKTESKQQIYNQDILQSLYSNGGSKEFKEKMGRNMTYEEMREMY